MEVRVRLERDEDGVYVATCPSLPGCISQGKTQREALKNIRDAIRLHVRALMADGLPLFKKQSSIREARVHVVV